MRNRKYYIALDDSEHRVIVNCLNEYSEQTSISYTSHVDYYLPGLGFLMKKMT